MSRLSPTRVRRRVLLAARRTAVRYAKRRGDLMLELFDPANWANPFPIHDAMRAHGPIYHSKMLRAYAMVSHEAATIALRDVRFKARRPEGRTDDDTGLGNNDSLIKMDPPRHTQVRKLLTKGFSLRAIDNMTSWIEDVCHELLDGVEGQTEFNAVEHIAFPLPVRVICHVLGIPIEHRFQIAEWGMAVAPTIDPSMTPQQVHTAGEASRAMMTYFRELVDDRRRNPRSEDVLTNLILATDEESGVSLTQSELLATCQLILVAGFGTSVGMLGSMVDRLTDEPEVWEELRADPELAGNAVEEVLRLESPVQLTLRKIEEDTEVLGVPMKAGSRVVPMMGGANRDPEVFPDPHRFDVRRENAGRHLAFTPGIHHCLGAPLARLEGRLMLQAMLERIPELRSGGPTQRYPTMNARGMLSVPVSAGPKVFSRTGAARAS